MLKLSEVCLTRNSNHLLTDISLTLPAGEITVLLGPNGAGKSTLLGLLAGLQSPDSGCVHLKQQSISEIDPPLRARFLAMYTQQQPLNFPFRVAEVVALGCYPLMLSPDLLASRVAACLAQFELQALAQRDYTSLSGGEQQRVQVARVLAQVGAECQVLLLDEPVSEMDLKYQQLLLQHIRAVADSGVAVCCVLHDLNLAAQVADQVVLLQQGEVIEVGAVATVMTAAKLSQLYGAAVTQVVSDPWPVFVSGP
ncbi:heme ABC transporter ATP-binding protein [Amphritea sp. 1_MG-2023]|uniref:heme ABC transporter ATP-binding protein n=1 Tax=Amphritea sp. 1_MG-2023 TaxID=3062670 RepID=UPI0026E17977|nr:heme ABC transporter ATP-binding protein [Amphritea sp. 1_MG-2023]MDO6563901.1 heme ABC transporter ATP-binding protein [Amphritea sp. 1_MG-2023]